MFETTFESRKVYADPFNDVAVDVVFTRGTESWRVPTFWHGGSKWTVRFAPREPGEYVYRLESTDPANPDLNGHQGRIEIRAYDGPNELLRHGAFRVSQNGRYFEHTDGTPFFWLGDTWWSALSDRLPWEGFKTLTADRKAKGYTVVQLAVMTVSNEEDAPSDPGFCNEGGCVWDERFERLNPRYFDFADRRIAYLVDAGIAPVVVGMWRQALRQMGLAKGKKFWRYIIARYGAYPVFWIGGGEVFDPSEDLAKRYPDMAPRIRAAAISGWTDLTRYIRATDPYGHPLSVHELPPPVDVPIQDESLTDFEFFQPSHFGWASVRAQIAQLNMHYARTAVRKPLIVAEIGWETLGGQHYEDLQRAAFWLAMLNGAAGFSYGNAATGESYTADKPFHRLRLSFFNWDEAMQFPSSAQLGWSAKLLQRYRWQHFAPHPEWVAPRGLTFLEPQSAVNGFDIDLMSSVRSLPLAVERDYPKGVWQTRAGDFRLPYAAGIAGEVRFVYLPAAGFPGLPPPTLLSLEPNVQYQACYWEPSLGVKVDLGKVQAEAAGQILHQDGFDGTSSNWEDAIGTSARDARSLLMRGPALSLLKGIKETDVTATVNARADAEAALVLRYKDSANYVAAIYSPQEQAIYVLVRKDGKDDEPKGRTDLSHLGATIRLTAEVRGNTAIVSVTDGQHAFTSPIIDLIQTPILGSWSQTPPAFEPGAVGLLNRSGHAPQRFDDFELRRPRGALVQDEKLERVLYDAQGRYRGTLEGKGWDAYGKNKTILLNAYRPELPPFPQDWVLVLESRHH